VHLAAARRAWVALRYGLQTCINPATAPLRLPSRRARQRRVAARLGGRGGGGVAQAQCVVVACRAGQYRSAPQPFDQHGRAKLAPERV